MLYDLLTVEAVKTIELMDIRDSEGSQVIKNIMAIKQSNIERDSCTQVAENMKRAEIAEIQARQEADLTRQEAEKRLGLKKVETEREVSLSNKKASQQVEAERKMTTEAQMAVKQIENTKQAEIEKEVAIINVKREQEQREISANADKQVAVVNALAEKEKQILIAQGQKEQVFLNATANLEIKEKEALGIARIGEAEAEAKKLLEISLVSGQISLAQEIGENEGYQRYLIQIRQVETNEKIGIEQAKTLSNADLKLIVNDGANVSSGMNKITDLFSATGGANLGNMLENLTQYPQGQAIVDKLLKKPQN